MPALAMVEVAIVDEAIKFSPARVVSPPWTIKELLFKVNVPVPDVSVSPFTVVKSGVSVKVICVEVPIKTFCPPLMFKFVPTVKLPSVVVPMPPLETGTRPTEVKLSSASVNTKEEAVRVAMLILPEEETVNWLLSPTVNSWEGDDVPIPTFPLTDNAPAMEVVAKDDKSDTANSAVFVL